MGEHSNSKNSLQEKKKNKKETVSVPPIKFLIDG